MQYEVTLGTRPSCKQANVALVRPIAAPEREAQCLTCEVRGNYYEQFSNVVVTLAEHEAL